MIQIVIIASIAILGALATWGFFFESGRTFFGSFRKWFKKKDTGITDLQEADRLSTAEELGAGPAGAAKDPHVVALGYYINTDIAAKVRKNPEQYGQLVCSEAKLPTTVFGPTGSGKTSTILTGAVLEWGEGIGPAMVTTVKYDLTKNTLKLRSVLGKVAIFDPTENTPHSMKQYLTAWTPLASAHHWKGAMHTAGAMVFATESGGTSDFWVVQTQSLLAALMFMKAQDPGSTMADVSKLLGDLETVGEPDEEAEEEGFQKLESDLINRIANAKMEVKRRKEEAVDGKYSVIEAAKRIKEAEERLDEFEACWETLKPVIVTAVKAPQTIGGVIAGVSNALSVYRLARAQSRIAWDDKDVFNIDKFIQSNDTLYIIAPPRNQELYAPILAAFASVVLDKAYELAQSSEEATLPIPLLAVLDEVHAVPVQDLPAIYATARSYNINVLTATQNYSQLCSKFGEDEASSLLDNSGTIVVLPRCKDPKTLQVLSTISGEVRVKSESKTVSNSSSKGDDGGGNGKTSGKSESITESWETRPLLPPGRIASFADGEAFTIVGAKRCQIALRPWYTDTRLQKLAEGDTSAFPAGFTVLKEGNMPGSPIAVVNFYAADNTTAPARRRRRSPRRRVTGAAE